MPRLGCSDVGEAALPLPSRGVGYFGELDKAIDYRRPAVAWNGGVGFRVHVTRRLFVAPDLRLGHITRFTVGGVYWF
jgi:hypothetical protein